MSDILGFATQIVILLTVVVGLFKVLVFKVSRADSPAENEDAPTSEKTSIALPEGVRLFFAPFLIWSPLIAIFGFMLIMLITLKAMMYISNIDTSATSRNQKGRSAALAPIEIDGRAEDPLWAAAFAADLAPSTGVRNELLGKVMERALASDRFDTGFFAAQSITSTSKMNNALERVAQAAAGESDFNTALAALSAITSTSQKNQLSERLVDNFFDTPIKNPDGEGSAASISQPCGKTPTPKSPLSLVTESTEDK